MARFDVRRQHDAYGGTNWGAGFFGWLVATGLAALLTALITAAGAAIAFSEIDSVGEAASTAVSDGDTISIVGAICLLAAALISYFAGGYVAGRMSRFDGARQGVAVWVWGIVAVIVLAIVGAVAGSEYNLLAGVDLPRIPVDEGDLTTGGIIALALILGGTLLAAIAGGKAGERYHRRVDDAGYVEERAVARDTTVVDRDRDGVDDRDEARGRFVPRDRAVR